MAANNGVNLFQMDFWDGMEPVFMMPTVTPAERKAVWDAVADSVQQQLSQHKGIRIPTLGSFDVVHAETLVGNKIVILQMPVFHLARNLGGVHSLENKDNLAGSKQLEPLKYARVAVEASVSRRKAECCVLGTTSLLYHCLEKGMSVAFVLRDVGVLFIEGSRVQMRFYLDFLEKVTGERIQDSDTLKALQQLDMVMSQAVSTASLSSTGRVVIFPNFEQTFPATSLPRDHLKDFGFAPGEDKKNKTDLSPLRQGMEGRFPGLPVPAQKDSSARAGAQPSLREEEAMEMGPSSRVRKTPVIPGAAAGGKQPVTDKAEGKPVPKGQASKWSDKEAAATQRGRGGRGERRDSLRKEREKKVQPGKERERKGSLGGEGEGERRDSLGSKAERRDKKEGERRDSLGREGERREKKGERRKSLSREGERGNSLGKEGEKKVGRGKEKKAKDAVGSEGEKKARAERGENEVSPRREGEKKVPPRRGEKKVPLRREEKKAPLRREEKKTPLGREEKKAPLRREEKKVPLRREEKKVPLGREAKKAPLGREGEKFRLKIEEVKYLLEREREKKLLPGRERERNSPLGSASRACSAQARKAQQDSKVFVPQRPGAEAPQALRARPEAFWSVLKEPQKNILAGYRFECSRLLPPLPLQGVRASQLPVLKKRERVARGPWPWVE